MADIVYDYTHSPTVKKFSVSDKFIRGLMGPFGSGKSSGCVIELVKWGAKQTSINGKRRSRFAVIRNTYPQLRDTTVKTFHDWVPPHFFGSWNKTEFTYLITGLDADLEIEIMFRALDRPEHVSNLLSLELTGAWVNEAREVPWAVIQALQGRVGRFPAAKDGGCVDPGIIMDTNPPDSDSWWYQLFEEKKPDNAALFKQPSGTAPEAENKPNLPPNYYENLLQTMDPDQIRVYVHGEYGFIKDGKPVYPEYNDAVHCVDMEPTQGVTIYRGWDFGLTPACVFSQLLPSGRWNTFDELVAVDLDIHSFADTVKLHSSMKYPWAKEWIDIGDPAGQARSVTAKPTEESTCFEILRSKGIMIEPGVQTVSERIGSVRWVLNNMSGGKPRMALHSRCKTLRKGYQGRYQYRRMRVSGSEERYHDVPDKNEFSHPHDANQYVAARLFGALLRQGSQQKPKPINYSKFKAIV